LLPIKVIAQFSWGKIIFTLIKAGADNPLIAAIFKLLGRQAVSISRDANAG